MKLKTNVLIREMKELKKEIVFFKQNMEYFRDKFFDQQIEYARAMDNIQHQFKNTVLTLLLMEDMEKCSDNTSFGTGVKAAITAYKKVLVNSMPELDNISIELIDEENDEEDGICQVR